MFKECINIKQSGAFRQYRYDYTIIDDNFQVITGWSGTTPAIGYIVAIHCSVIKIYKTSNLPIVPNLIRAMLWTKNIHYLSLDEQVRWNKKHNPNWHEVDQDIKKYLLFS